MFWSTDTLKKRLPDLITDYDKKRVGASNYTLTVGSEVYVSPTAKPRGPKDKSKIQLGEQEDFTIPSGQFAFLITEETVEVPNDALAFISIRATYKFQGLVNVSGFHVDPNFKGKLIFAVFNAGPSPICLERGEKCFHIWYASLDRASPDDAIKGYDNIPTKVTNRIGVEVMSFDGLKATIDDTETRLSDRIATIESNQRVAIWATRILIGLGIAIFIAVVVKGGGITPNIQTGGPAPIFNVYANERLSANIEGEGSGKASEASSAVSNKAGPTVRERAKSNPDVELSRSGAAENLVAPVEPVPDPAMDRGQMPGAEGDDNEVSEEALANP